MKHISQLIAQMKNGSIQTASQFFKALKAERSSVRAPSQSFDRFIGIEDTNHFQALQRLVMHKSIFIEEMYLRQAHKADWQNTDIRIRRFTAAFIEALRKRNIPFYPHCAFRTKAEQNDLYNHNKSQLRFPAGQHCQGNAVDLVHSQFHWSLTQMEWDVIGKLGKAVSEKIDIPIRWGGDWDRDGRPVHSDPDENFWDPAHWELHDRPQTKTIIKVAEPVRYTPRKLLLVSGKS